jgi:fucokinase
VFWDSDDKHTIWEAKLYPSCKTVDEAVDAALNLYDLMHGRGDVDAWLSADRKSLHSGFYEADTQAILDWDTRMGDLVRMDRLSKLIKAQEPAEKGIGILNSDHLTSIQEKWFDKQLKDAQFMEKVRLYYYVGTAVGGKRGEEMIAESFAGIRDAILKAAMNKIQINADYRIVKEHHTVRLPLRVNWGGGWSDTPPYCNENGGTVLNAAITLNGRYPVEVTLIRLKEKKIIFDSRDMDVHGEFERIEELQRTGDPYDPFALQKAALLACGIIPKAGGDLSEILTELGGGFEMHSEVVGVPKGSGLGTSSILAAASIKAIFEFTGIRYTGELLYSTVLCMEQIMSTGGGWQDQVGGLSNGVKLITSQPGIWQDIEVQQISLSEKAKEELQERFALIYTGQRRLARNLLRDVVGSYIGAKGEAKDILNEIQKNAVLMSFELKRGNIDEFASLLNVHWELSRRLDAGSSNTLIDQIFDSISDLIDGRMICGAGGGGFLQVILKKGVKREQIHERLKAIFMDSEIDVWDSEFVWGMNARFRE